MRHGWSQNITIRKVELDDISSCLEVEASHEDSTFSEHDFRKSIADPNVIYLVAEQNHQVIRFILGFIMLTRRKEATIHLTMVHRQYSRKGIGSTLVQKFVEQAFEHGVELIFAEVEEGIYKFYEKCGLKKVGVWYSMVLLKALRRFD